MADHSSQTARPVDSLRDEEERPAAKGILDFNYLEDYTPGAGNRAWQLFIVTKSSTRSGATGAPGYIFGPVPSRRLGRSLGVDLAPVKTCTLDCLYCEVGPTTCRTLERFHRHMAPAVLAEFERFLAGPDSRIDFVTLAGSGEPTLNLEIEPIIAGIKDRTDVPVAILTNGTLLTDPEVRREIGRADLVIPSLDTARAETFRRLNRPHPDLDPARIIQGLLDFRTGYAGRLWLEVLLVAGYNDQDEELEAIRAVIDRLEPDLVQINTVFRPPAHPDTMPVTPETLARAARIFGPLARAVSTFKAGGPCIARPDRRNQVLDMLARRPCTAEDVAAALGLAYPEAAMLLKRLLADGLIHREAHHQQDFFRAVPREEPPLTGQKDQREA